MLNFGNVDTEILLPNSAARVWEVCVECPNWKEKKKFDNLIVAMSLLKIGGKKIMVAEIWGGIKKKSVTFIIFSQ